MISNNLIGIFSCKKNVFSATIIFKIRFKNRKKNFAYFDRACYRFPDKIFSKGGLGLHIDCNPWNMQADREKWRPLQMSLALTDHPDENCGGLGVARGWHTKIVDLAEKKTKKVTFFCEFIVIHFIFNVNREKKDISVLIFQKEDFII